MDWMWKGVYNVNLSQFFWLNVAFIQLREVNVFKMSQNYHLEIIILLAISGNKVSHKITHKWFAQSCVISQVVTQESCYYESSETR